MSMLKIVIPTFNYLEGLKRNLDIMDLQISLGGYEVSILISDDSTTNDIKDFCQTLFQRKKNYSYKEGPKMGPVANWNNSIQSSEAVYTLFIHHDEYLGSKEFFSTLMPILETQEFDIVILPLKKNKNTKFYSHYPNWLKYLYLVFPRLLFSCNPFGPPSVFIFKTELFNRFDGSLIWFVDVEWYYQFLRKRPKVKITTSNLLNICSDVSFPSSITKSINLKRLMTEEANLISKKHHINKIIFSQFFYILRLPVKLYEWFQLKN